MLQLHLRMILLFLLYYTFFDQVFNSALYFFREEIDAIGDWTKVFMNYITEDTLTSFKSFLKILMENRMKKYSWLGWYYLGLYIIYVAVTYYQSKDLDEFCEKMMKHTKHVLQFLLYGEQTLPKVRQNQLGEAEEGNKKISDKKVVRTAVCWCCLESDTPLLRCGGCMKARYCGQRCQEEDWGRHGAWCRRRERKVEKRRKKKSRTITETNCEVD